MPLESIFDMLGGVGGHSNKPDAWDADQRWKRRGSGSSAKPKKPKKKAQQKQPCPGNPVPNPQVAPQKNSGIRGGMFGWTRSGGKQYHGGLDLKANYGDPIYAMYDGIAKLETEYNRQGRIDGLGYFVRITSMVKGKKIQILYSHLKKRGRILGSIKRGQVIGYLGDFGNLKRAISRGKAISHVHIKVKELQHGTFKTVDPIPYLTTKIDPKTGKVIKKYK